ncbi:MAG: ABC transporter ATP-binding protein/permease [Clostridia bacterium]|nr:ABC transporter ATP-binding protein/permease [Clostridia bacterium]
MKRTIGYLKPYAGVTAAALTIKFTGSVAELVLPYILSYIIDDLIPLKDISRIYIMGGIMILFAVIALAGNIIANRLSAIAAGKMTHDLRYDLFSQTCYLKSSQVDGFTMPSLISRLTSDTYYVNQMVARSMRMGVRAPILLIGGLIFSFVLDPFLALIMLAAMPFVCIGIYFITKKSVPMYTAVQKSGDKMVRSVQENITGIRVIKALSKGDYENGKFEGVAGEVADNDFKANRIMSLTNPLTTLILNICLVAVIIVGAALSEEPGVMTAYLSYFTIVLNAMLGISKIFVELSRGIASASRIEKVLEADPKEEVTSLPKREDGSVIAFEEVNFSYNGKENNLNGITFCLKKGQSLGIIGPTGCGKSTLINLMMRFYDVDSGDVYIDGLNVKSYNPAALRSKFGTVFQNDFLMADSVRANIDYGRNIPEEDIVKAAECAQAAEFIYSLPEGLDYDLAQKAGNLSGGQKQRLLVARALAGNPEIIVLDDSSSALDYATDAAMRKAITSCYPSATKVIIAQRVSSIKNCDLILIMEDGEITGCGSHEQLMAENVEYRRIAETQMGAGL